MHKPRVSVIIAVFNQERFIGRCLRSLLHQTISHHEFEIIVVDDGSVDKTAYALNLFCDPAESVVKVITNEVNLGLPASLNIGILSAKADLIVRVDSDDFVNTNFLNFLLSYMELNPTADAVACDYLLLNDVEEVLERKNCLETPIACGIMFQKKHLLEIGLYDESFLRHEERDLRLRFEKLYKISGLHIPLYRYRRHESNITNDTTKMELYREGLIKKHGKDVNN
jgi:glycosyltransferase involved in cell wall biosynthesis